MQRFYTALRPPEMVFGGLGKSWPASGNAVQRGRAITLQAAPPSKASDGGDAGGGPQRRPVMSKILIVLSAADTWTRADGSQYESGVWAEEFVVMDERFVAAGCEVDIATPGGVRPTIDPHSINPAVVGQENVDHFRAYLDRIADRIAQPLVLGEVQVAGYDAVVIPGGHGPVEDLHKDPDMGRLLAEADRAGKLIAPVCHGQAALLAAKAADGSWLFAGRAMTAFSDEEEVELGTADNAPWLLADTLRKAGARYQKGPNWGPYVVTDGNLLSGQNPASSAPLADAVLAALR
jgi:putative intracellular protease/amidase